MSDRKWKAKGAGDILKILFDEFVMFHPQADGKVPVPHLWIPAKSESNLVILVGDNASGKSVARRIISQICREVEPRIEPMAVSMQGRTGGGMANAFIYGDEGFESTGQVSARTVTTGIATCRNRKNPHMVFWDEPDLGLSDSWAAGVGVAIAEFSQSLPEMTKGVFVVTHSKALVTQLLSVPHHYVHFGDDKKHPADLTAWCNKPVRSRSIEKLADISRKRYQAIQAAINANKREK
jgi:hypothetical protein